MSKGFLAAGAPPISARHSFNTKMESPGVCSSRGDYEAFFEEVLDSVDGQNDIRWFDDGLEDVALRGDITRLTNIEKQSAGFWTILDFTWMEWWR